MIALLVEFSLLSTVSTLGLETCYYEELIFLTWNRLSNSCLLPPHANPIPRTLHFYLISKITGSFYKIRQHYRLTLSIHISRKVCLTLQNSLIWMSTTNWLHTIYWPYLNIKFKISTLPRASLWCMVFMMQTDEHSEPWLFSWFSLLSSDKPLSFQHAQAIVHAWVTTSIPKGLFWTLSGKKKPRVFFNYCFKIHYIVS